MKLLILVLTLIALPVQASEVDCLASLMYAEARGESIEGVIAVGYAARNRAAKTHESLCAIAKHKSVDAKLKPAYLVLANLVIQKKIKDITLGADSWLAQKTIPKHRGEIKRKIGKHWFSNWLPDMKLAQK